MKNLQYTIPFVLLLSMMSLSDCKPTPRTVHDRPAGQEAQQGQPVAVTATHTEQEPTRSEESRECPVGLLSVHTTYQEYDPIRPWEKGTPQVASAMGVYLGDNRLLTAAGGMSRATFVEISLPDMSRTVPAKVLKVDDDLGLALLSVLHESDKDIFENLPALDIGEPIRIGGKVRLHALVQGEIPVSTELVAESAFLTGTGIPALTTRSQSPLPHDMSVGLPALRDGHLTGMVVSYNGENQAVNLINAEMLQRFLEQSPENTGVPVVGLSFASLDDPAFCRYLKLDPGQGGLYISKVAPLGAGAAAGIRKGDVLTGIEGMPLDKRGKIHHPIYGTLNADMRSLKPLGESVVLDISRDGTEMHIPVQLNRDAIEKGPFCYERGSAEPRYAMWGGMLFLPLTGNYLNALKEKASNLPLSFLRAKEQTEEIIKAGRQDVVALTLVIPTPATLGYESLGFCIVEAVNGTPITSFAQFVELLDTDTPDGITELSISHAPYKIYLDRKTVERSNAVLSGTIHKLRNLNSSPAAPSAPTPHS